MRSYRVDDIAERWHCSAEHVRRLIRRGELIAIQPAGAYVVLEDALLEFEKGVTNGPAEIRRTRGRPRKGSV